MKKSNHVLILLGGHSDEREVSLVSGSQVAQALSALGWRTTLLDPADCSSYIDLFQQIKDAAPDVVFMGLHGGAGEDGRIQAMLELMGIPFTGSRSKAGAVAMDKLLCNRVAMQLGLAVPRTISLGEKDARSTAITEIGFPLVVKPNGGGSSVGVTVAASPADLPAAIELAGQSDTHVLLQQFIPGRELTVTILDRTALPVVEIKPREGWYDYHHKYTKGETVYEAPAQLDESVAAHLREQGLAIYNAIGAEGYARVDFRYDGETCWFLEVNTLPGMTPLSLTPMAAREAGYDFSTLLQTIVQTALAANWQTPTS